MAGGMGGGTMGPGMMGGGYGPGGQAGQWNCPGMTGDSQQTSAQITEGKAKELAQQYADFLARFGTFEADTPNGKITFRGNGEKEASPAWQRAVAAWAMQVYFELETGRASAGFNTVIVILKVAIVLSDISEPGRGQTLCIPGSHLNNSMYRPTDPAEIAKGPEGAVPWLAKPGDAITAVSTADGGHISHARFGSAGLRGLQIATYPFQEDEMTIDAEGAAKVIRDVKPKIALLGSSAAIEPLVHLSKILNTYISFGFAALLLLTDCRDRRG